MTGIVILNYETWEISLKCIRNIAKTHDGLPYHIYLVDNASPTPIPEDFRAYLLLHNEWITFLQARENRGYAAGNNIGIRQALKDGCKNLLIANNDILFCAGAIQTLVGDLDNEKKIGIAGPKVLDEKGIIQNSRCSMKTGIKEVFQLFTAARFFFRKKWNRYYCMDQDTEKPVDVYYVSGCCFAMSRECAMAVTPLDEGTFLYDEELILGIRMEQAGYRTWYDPESVVVHQHAATTRKRKPFMYQCISQSELYYCAKYLHAKKRHLKALYHYRRALYWLRSKCDKDLKNYWKIFERETREWYENLTLYVRNSTCAGRRPGTVCDRSNETGNADGRRRKAVDSRSNTDCRNKKRNDL